jgi:hypothetical protein
MAVVKGFHKIKLVYTHESSSGGGGGMNKNYIATPKFNYILQFMVVH